MDFTSRNQKFRERSSANAIPIGSVILDLPPSCLEFVPVSEAAPDNPLFVVGTYDLQKEEGSDEATVEEPTVSKEQSRQGSLTLFSLQSNVLTEIQTFPTPSAILDLHFFPETTIFAVASSTGTITIFQVQRQNIYDPPSNPKKHVEIYGITQIATHQVLDQDNIITYFAWDPTSKRDSPRMAITSTTGTVTLLSFSQSFDTFEFLYDGQPLNQHSYEAWCCAFSERGQTLYSGGDDSKLIRSSLTSEFLHQRTLPFHEAGVTAILPIPLAPQTTSTDSPTSDTTLLLTGSYDDHIRIYEPSSLSSAKPTVLASKDIGLSGGGVWRLKFLSINEYPPTTTDSSDDVPAFQREFIVLASCMRVGCKILSITHGVDGSCEIEVRAQTAIHESMNYASDVVPLALGGTSLEAARAESGIVKRTIVSASFYDRLLFVWSYDPSIRVAAIE